MRIVLDLGTSWLWTRPPVGIVRTEQRFARHLIEHADLPVAFCRFDKALGCHVEVTREAARALVMPACDDMAQGEVVDADVSTVTSVSPAVAPSTKVATSSAWRRLPKLRLRERAAAVAKRGGFAIVRRFPEPLRPDATETLRAGYHFAKDSARLARQWIRVMRARAHNALVGSHRKLKAATPPQAFTFDRDDVYFSMGLDWAYNDIRAVYQQRRKVGFRTVLFCYDIIPVRFPHLMSFDARQSFGCYFVDLAHTADNVVAISETSRRDYLDFLRETEAPEPPVNVVVLGTDLAIDERRMRPPMSDLEDIPFVLCVSTIEARKNHEVLYNTWDRLAEKHGEGVPLLVIVGMVGWGVEELLFRMRTNPRVRERIRILDKLPDGELAWLYRHALFTVFPSLYEGWGLPVVESLAYGTPCICSTASAIAEAAQGLATIVDPLDTPGWVRAVENLWLDGATRAELAVRCTREFRPQLWRDHAVELLRIGIEGSRR